MSDSRLTDHLGATLALGLLVLAGLASLAATPLAGNPLDQDLTRMFLPPLSPGHLLGTDHLGRDVLSRVLHGGRSSFVVSLGSAGIAAVLGTFLGIVSAMDRKGSIDRVLQVLNDAILAFPTILLAITVAILFSPGMYQVTVTLGIVFAPVLYRVSRVEARRVMQQEFYLVSQMLGTGRVLRGILHLLPNLLPQVLVQSASLAALAIGTEAALSFLGLGTQPPHPSWGLMLSDARRYLVDAPYLSVFPGAAAALLAFCFQVLSDYGAEFFHLQE
ncbi:hypothetical protein AU468_03170 [Alkalispirochaeta sphaeroplastigenens]|uniref:ABC transmembrane type-1 domain-containing protein n=1 Tax=Alkalispirochaeta sphaeroplastigenens TaxID=1187066 RepID=A0A2S4JYP8_9SPIO|nr:ABC transporter permease [Alkalispirochaeta sphaeroplastigenens]POR04634.1 hypothetical protein AU468_03170 [Alkalispirochaeta sphaeroplastigenens]